MPNTDATLTKTEKEELKSLGIYGIYKAAEAKKKLWNKIGQFIQNIEKDPDLELDLHDYPELSEFVEYYQSNPESLRITTMQFEQVLNKAKQLQNLAYKGKQPPSGKPKTKAEAVNDFYRYRAINFKNLQAYDHRIFKTLEEIVVFEHLLFLEDYFCRGNEDKQFFHSKQDFRKEIKIKATTLETVFKKFEKWKVLTRETKGMPRVTYFRLNREKIDKIVAVSIKNIKDARV